jgi:hypothetical protein
MPSPSSRPALFALCGMALALLWQWATVTVNYGGNWSALFETGALADVPASLENERLYRFQASRGYDGQAYHYIAHDPFLRRADLRAAVDEPRLRYRRILVPGLAWLLAFGQSGAVDLAYFAVCLLFSGLGVWWSSRLCLRLGFPAAFGLAFLLAPAVLVALDRMVVDVALAALTVAFVLYLERPGARLWLVLAAAALSRETGWFLVLAYCAHLAVERRWTAALRYASACAPAAAWYLYVALHTAGFDYGEQFIPLASTLGAIFHPQAYPAGTPLPGIVQAADILALAGALAAFVLAVYLIAGLRRIGPESFAALCFTLTGIFSQRPDQWQQVFDFGRVYTPLLLLLAVQAMRRRQMYWLAPWLMMTPRVAMQFAPQVAAVARSLWLR